MKSRLRYPHKFTICITNEQMKDIKKAMKLPEHKGKCIADMVRYALEVYSIKE